MGKRDKCEACRAFYLFFTTSVITGFIRVREMSGKFNFFQGQGIVREFYAVSVKNEVLLKCQGNVREFYKLQFVTRNKRKSKAVFLTFWVNL